MDTTLMAGFDQQLNIRLHKRNSHRDVASVREHELRIIPELFDDRENVVPATTVETRAVLTEFVDNFVHLKRGKDGLDENSTPNGTPRNRNPVLGKVENIIPKAGLEVRLHLGQIEVRPMPTLDQFLRIVEKIKAEIEQAARDRFSINGEMFLLKMPATGPKWMIRSCMINAGSKLTER